MERFQVFNSSGQSNNALSEYSRQSEDYNTYRTEIALKSFKLQGLSPWPIIVQLQPFLKELHLHHPV